MPPAQEQSVDAAPTRGARRRERTNARLMQAARVLFARQGIDATTIAEITQEADVGFGSFYNHFDSKDDILDAVLVASIDEQGSVVDALTEGLDDPAEVMSVAHRHFVTRAQQDPDWARLIVRLDASHRVLLRALGARAARDLDNGIAAGRFHVADPRVALFAMGGALLGVMQAVVNGDLDGDAAVHHAEGLLRMLGLDQADARAVVALPMPSI